MQRPLLALLASAALITPALAFADPHKHGPGKHGHHKHKDTYWDGHCQVERQWKKNGDYKEKRKCKGPAVVHHAPAYAPVPVYVPAPEPGLVIQGTVRLR